MINDLVTRNEGMQQSIFADDLAYYKSGKSLQNLVHDMQEEMNHVHAWSQKWGFTPSPTKTALMPFVRSDQSAPYLAVSIGNNFIPNVTSFKFLGLTLDQHLKYDVHISNLITKCKRRLNLMRAVAGTTYGCARKPLLTIYKALIRSLIDYGSIVYDAGYGVSAHFEGLQRIQNQALRLACGTNLSTPIVALQNECGEMPLQFRRKLLIRHYRIKVQESTHHPCASVFDKNCQPTLNARTAGRSYFHTLYHKSGNFKVTPNPLFTPKIIFNHNIHPDLTLAKVLNKTDNLLKLKNLTLDKISQYQHLDTYFTDASKDEAGQVGIAIILPGGIPPTSTRLTDHTTVYRAELEAIMQVVGHIVDEEKDESVIFTDSLSVVQAVANVRNAVANEEIKFLCEYANNAKHPIHLCWIPGHAGIPGNEQADHHAKEATKLADVQVPITHSTSYYRQQALQEILPLWQEHYDQAEAGRRYKAIEPTVSTTIKDPIYNDRWKDKVTALVKLGSLYTNERKVKCNIHTDPKCESCKEEETLEHLVYQCTANQVATNICQHLRKTSDQITIAEVVRNPDAMSILFQYLTTTRPDTIQPFPKRSLVVRPTTVHTQSQIPNRRPRGRPRKQPTSVAIHSATTSNTIFNPTSTQPPPLPTPSPPSTSPPPPPPSPPTSSSTSPCHLSLTAGPASRTRSRSKKSLAPSSSQSST